MFVLDDTSLRPRYEIDAAGSALCESARFHKQCQARFRVSAGDLRLKLSLIDPCAKSIEVACGLVQLLVLADESH